jgi:2'-5' RNA ligase
VTRDSAKDIVAYWLIPAEPALSHFRSLINELAARFDAPVFEPHVTVYVTNAVRENPAAALARAVAYSERYRLSIAGLDSSDEFTKTLFVQFQPDLALARLSENLRSASVSQGEYQLNPHLSLIYKPISRETKEQIRNAIQFPFTEVFFDSVKAIISPAEIKTRKQVEAWRIVATRELTG